MKSRKKIGYKFNEVVAQRLHILQDDVECPPKNELIMLSAKRLDKRNWKAFANEVRASVQKHASRPMASKQNRTCLIRLSTGCDLRVWTLVVQGGTSLVATKCDVMGCGAVQLSPEQIAKLGVL